MTKKKRGLAFAAAGYPVVGIALLFSFIMLLFIFKFYSAYEVSVTDRVFTGISASNHFVMMKNNMETYVPFVAMTTAYELGQEGGGLGNFWISSGPELDSLKDIYMESLQGKFGFPEKVGPFSRLSAEIPDHNLVYGPDGSGDNKAEILVEEDNVKVSMFPYGFESGENVNSFDLSAGVEAEGTIPPEFEKDIRYVRMLGLMRNFFDEGIYIRDADKVTFESGTAVCCYRSPFKDVVCSDIDLSGKTASYFLDPYALGYRHGASYGFDYCVLTEETVFSVKTSNNLDVLCGPKTSVKTERNGDNYYGEIRKYSDGNPRVYMVYIPTETMLKTAILCGYGKEDGLAGIDDFEGLDRKSQEVGGISECLDNDELCNEDDAVSSTDWVKIDSKIEKLKDAIVGRYTEFYLGSDGNEGIEISIDYTNKNKPGRMEYEISDNHNPPKSTGKSDYEGVVCLKRCDDDKYIASMTTEKEISDCESDGSTSYGICSPEIKFAYECSCLCYGYGSCYDGDFCDDRKNEIIEDSWENGWFSHTRCSRYELSHCDCETDEDGSESCDVVTKPTEYRQTCEYQGIYTFNVYPRFSISLKDTTLLVPEKDSGISGGLNPLELKINTGLDVTNIASTGALTELNPVEEENR